MLRCRVIRLIMACLLLLNGQSVVAGDFVIGLASAPTSLDPHYHFSQPNWNLSRNTFETLISSENSRPDPLSDDGETVVAKSELLGPTRLRMTLKPDIYFHNDKRLTVDDIMYTIERIRTYPEPSGFQSYASEITEMKRIDDLTLDITTSGQASNVMSNLRYVLLVPKPAGYTGDKADFEKGVAMIGTGKYRFIGKSGDNIYQFQRFERFHGEKPFLETASLRYVGDPGERLRLFMAGELQLLEQLTPAQVDLLNAHGTYNITKALSNRTIVLSPDLGRTSSPFITDLDGKLLTKNPLQDLRVRQAISKAINRVDLTQVTLKEAGEPSGQLMSAATPSYLPDLKPDTFDPEAARRLLAEAGYPDGFRITLHAPNDRYIEDAAVAKQIADMLTKVGIRTELVTYGKDEFFKRLRKHEFSLAFKGWATASAENVLVNSLATADSAKGMGATNDGAYSNPELDELVGALKQSQVQSEHEKLIRMATTLTVNDLAVIPLYTELAIWATQKDFVYNGNVFGNTFIGDVFPAKQ